MRETQEPYFLKIELNYCSIPVINAKLKFLLASEKNFAQNEEVLSRFVVRFSYLISPQEKRLQLFIACTAAERRQNVD
jgi:hypothetical protein